MSKYFDYEYRCSYYVFNGNFIDLIIDKDNVGVLLSYSGILILGYIVSIVLNYGYQSLSLILREELSFSLSSKLIKHIHRVSILKIKNMNHLILHNAFIQTVQI